VALSYIGFFSGVGKFGNLRGCVLRGQEVADFGQWISDTLVYIVIGIVWQSVIGKYCDCGSGHVSRIMCYLRYCHWVVTFFIFGGRCVV
jgi:hypothetical protein